MAKPSRVDRSRGRRGVNPVEDTRQRLLHDRNSQGYIWWWQIGTHKDVLQRRQDTDGGDGGRSEGGREEQRLGDTEGFEDGSLRSTADLYGSATLVDVRTSCRKDQLRWLLA
ncbi:hypothetical protein PIB30_085941 [Stylosanthes scabra]|uniref:Uncharacterized protein n=1 Tax=Stylosanthes scabra TaxID=79078 RepID=A0ABU6WVS4_9FABA|nr:hypothetical protein [Stylosanthes scabra]